MAITRYAGDRYVVDTSDVKPTGVLPGAFLVDSGNRTSWIKTGYTGSTADSGDAWVQMAGGGGGGSPGGSNTQVQYNNGGSFAGSSNLTFTNGNQLNVNKLKISANVIDSNNSIGGNGMVLTNEGTTGVNWKNIESVLSGVGGSGVANYVARWSDEDTITSGVIQDDGTAVGINQAADPDNALAIKSIANNTNPLQIAAHDGDSLLVFRQTAGDGRLSIKKDGGVETIRLDSDNVSYITGGSVGIGITNPASVLHLIDSNDGGATELIIDNSAAAGSTDELSNIRFRHAGKTSAFIKVGREADLSTTANTDMFLALWTTENDSPSEKMRIIADGNVGIGTTTPGSIFHVYSSASAMVKLQSATGNNDIGIDFFRGSDRKWQIRNNGNDDSLFIIPQGVNDADATFAIKSDGNVGIGTNSPSHRLNVLGATTGGWNGLNLNVVISSSNTYANGHAGGIAFGGAYNSSETQTVLAGVWASRPNAGDGQYAGMVHIGGREHGTSNIAQVLTVTHANVGIGTVSPATKFEVRVDSSDGSASTHGAHIGTANNGLNIGANDAGNYAWIQTKSNDNLSINPYGAKVGIGTTGPDDKLHIVGDNGDQLKLDNDGDTWTQLNFATSGTSKTFLALDNDNHYFVLGAQGGYSDLKYISFRPDGTNDDMVIERGGNVGIGTTTPGGKLESYITSGGEKGLRLNSNFAGGNTVDFIPAIVGVSNAGFSIDLAGTNRFVIDSNGNVGIGTNDPDAELQVMNNDSSSYRFGYGGTSDVYLDADDVYFRSDNGGANQITKKGGSLGIGVVNAEHKLHVAGDAIISGYLYDSTNSTGVDGYVLTSKEDGPQWKMIEEVLSGVGGNGTANYVPKWTDSDTLGNSVIYDDGDIGIGTNDPQAKLHIDGGLIVSGDATTGMDIVGESNYYTRIIGNDETHPTQSLAGGRIIAPDSRRLYFELQGNDVTDHFRFLTSPNNDKAADYVAMHIGNNGSVGIGTNAPNSKVDVLAASRSTAFAASNGATWHDLIVRNPNNTQNAAVGLAFELNATYHANAAAGIAAVKEVGSSDYGAGLAFVTRPQSAVAEERVRITADGSVGIGTTAPQYLLEVYGDATLNSSGATTDVTLRWEAAGATKWRIKNDTAVAGGTAHTLTFTSAGAANVSINQAGNVGIGTNAPEAALTVAHLNAHQAIFRTAQTTASERAGGGFSSSGNATAASRYARLFLDADGANFSGTDYFTIEKFGNSGEVKLLQYSNANMSFWVNTTTQAMTIKNDGNVGIGTTAPVTIFHSSKRDLSDDTVTEVARIEGVKTGTAYNSSLVISSSFAGSTVANRFIDLSVFDHNPTSRSLILQRAGGSVGIGTAAPYLKLHVYGTGDQTNETNGTFWFGDNTTGAMGLYGGVNNTNDYAYIGSVRASQAYEPLILNPNGANIGIGVTDPDAKLEIKGAGASTGLTFKTTDSSSNNTFWVMDGGKAGLHYYPFVINQDNSDTDCPASTYFYVHHASAPFTIKNDGKVGVGTTNPSEHLHVRSASGAAAIFERSDAASVGIRLLGSGMTTSTCPKIHAEAGPDLAFTVNNAERMRILDTGNVGIGTTAPNFAAAAGNTVKGLNIQNVGQDTQASLRLTGHNASGSPGVATYTELLHAGANLRFDINHNGTVRFSIGSGGAITFNSAYTFPTAIGSAGQVLKVPSSGTVLEWSTETGPVSGTGTVNTIPRWTGTTALGDSIITVPSNTSVQMTGELTLNYASPILNIGKLNTSTGNAKLRFNSKNGTAANAFDIQFVKNATADRLDFLAGGATARVSFLNDGNVGIGTTAPAKLLTVESTSSPIIGIYSTYADAGARNWAISTNNAAYGDFTISNSAANGGNPNAIKLSILKDGNVGIGTNNPASLLTVYEDDSSAGNTQIYIHNDKNDDAAVLKLEGKRTSTNDTAQVLFANSGNSIAAIKALTDGADDGLITFSTSANGSGDTLTEYMRIKADGNVGIGTDNPSEKLHAYRVGVLEPKFQSSNGRVGLQLTAGDTGDANWILYSGYPAAGDFTIREGGVANHIVVKKTTGSVGIGTTDPSSLLTLQSSVAGAVDIFAIKADDGGNLYRVGKDGSDHGYIELFDGASTPIKVRLDSSGDSYFNGGSVGIGTDAPDSKLEIAGGSYNSSLKIKGGGGETGIQFEDSAGNTDGYIYGSDSKVGILDTGADWTIECKNDDYIRFATNGNTEHMRIEANGSVGIGITNPSAKLHVHSGDIVITSSKQLISINPYTQAPPGMLTTQGPSTGATTLGSGTWGIMMGPEVTRSTTANTYYPGIAFNHLLNNGGITTWNNHPQAWIGTRLHDTSGSERAFLVFSTKSGTGLTSSDVPLERMCIDPANGSVGIGTTDPAAQLQIGRSQSTSAFTDSFIKLRPSNTTNSSGLTSITLGTSTVDNYGYSISGWRAGTDGSPYLRIKRHSNSASGDDVMVMDNAGNVGIGTTVPGTNKLFVNGSSLLDGNAYIDGILTMDGDIDFESAGQYITFYGDSGQNHSISSRNSSGDAADDIRINTYGALFINLDSNNNNTSGADFSIGRHGQTGAITDWLLDLSGETGKLKLNKYGSGTHTGTTAYRLSVDSSGNVIETAIGAGYVDGSGTANYIAKWTDADTIGNSLIQDDGTNVGIGTTGNGYKLRVQGNVYISGTLTEASSLAIKENIEDFTPRLDIINKIRPVKYNKKKESKKEIGLIAEELAELFPELVEKDEKGNPSGVNYSRAVTVLLGGFKELYKEVQELKKRI